MSTLKREFTLRLDDKVFEIIEQIAKREHRSITNLIEYVLLNYIDYVDSGEEPKKDYSNH